MVRTFMTSDPLPWGAGRILFNVVAQSTLIEETNNSPVSALRSFFCPNWQLLNEAIFHFFAAASLLENFKNTKCTEYSIPRIMSTTRRILREVGVTQYLRSTWSLGFFSCFS